MAEATCINRRRLLKAAPLSLAAASLAGAVNATEPDPIIPLYEDWWSARLEWVELSKSQADGEWDEPVMNAAEQRESAAFDALLEARPTTLQGAAALLHVYWAIEGPAFAPGTPKHEEALRRPCNRLILTLWKFASGADALPPHDGDDLIIEQAEV